MYRSWDSLDQFRGGAHELFHMKRTVVFRVLGFAGGLFVLHLLFGRYKSSLAADKAEKAASYGRADKRRRRRD